MSIVFDNHNQTQSLWSLRDIQATSLNWQLASVNIGKLGTFERGWYIRFESNLDLGKSTSFFDYVAIDDISFAECNPDNNYQKLKCDFEVDFCAWQNDLKADFNWTRNALAEKTGPPGDQ
jgi:hypothetical protein